MLKCIILLLLLSSNKAQFTTKLKCLWSECEKVKESSLFQAFNPYCWVTNCNEKNVKKVEWNPVCWFKSCDDNHYKTSLNPTCWFVNCDKKDKSFFERYNLYCLVNKCESSDNEEKVSWIRQKLNKISDFFEQNKYSYKSLKKIEFNPYCWYKECCNNNAIPGDTKKLRTLTKELIYGQPFVDTVVDIITVHWDDNVPPKKPLVLSFHGDVGTGKNYVSKLIAKSLFKQGLHSEHVHLFTGKKDFTLNSLSEIYQENLFAWLRGNVTNCPKQLFIFDEVEEISESVLDGIKPMLDYKPLVDGADYTKSIFIFISNIGAKEIQRKYTYLTKYYKREDLLFRDFENLLSQVAFNEQGGFYHSDTISANVIDHYIPFLPMERQQVRECIKYEFVRHNVPNPDVSHVEAILDLLAWGYDETNEFSKTGCKTIITKVALVVAKSYPSASNEEL